MTYYRVMPEADALDLAQRLSGWEQGKARTKALTGTTKQNEEILAFDGLDKIGNLILSHAEVQLNHLPLQCHNPKASRYTAGMHYKAHTDAPWMGTTRTDLSCTLWLSDGYVGGELVVDGRAYKGKPGECLLYDCGSVHEVTPVTDGERICVVTWVQSRIRDKQKRQIVSDFRKFLAGFEDKPEFLEGSRLYSGLLRRWID